MRTAIISGLTVEFYLFPFIYSPIDFQVQLQTNYNLVVKSFLYVSGTLQFKTDRNLHLWQFCSIVYSIILQNYHFSFFQYIVIFRISDVFQSFFTSNVYLFGQGSCFVYMFLALWVLAPNWPFCLTIASKKPSMHLFVKHVMTSFLYERLNLKTKESDSLRRTEKVSKFTTGDNYLNSVLWWIIPPVSLLVRMMLTLSPCKGDKGS